MYVKFVRAMFGKQHQDFFQKEKQEELQDQLN